jgi:diketogulonate reductase-like aldo/keto reductase
MPEIIYGTAWKKDRTAALVVDAVQAGFKAIDTACQPKHYAEEQVGKALQELQEMGITREDLYVQTKFTPLAGQDPNQIPYDKNAPLAEQVAQSFEVSKKNLHTHYLDALLLHSPLFPFSELLTVWQAMEKIYKDQEVKALGISNCYDFQVLQRLYKEAEIKPTIVQNRFYDETSYDSALRSWALDHDISYQSFWTLTANPHILASETLQSLAQKHQKSPAQILFCYLRHVGVTPLTGTTSTEHMREDLQSLDFSLSDDEVQAVTTLLKQQ